MLADQSVAHSIGRLADGILAQGQSREAIIEFVRGQLPVWRDRPERPPQSAETRLTSQLCAHLNSAARMQSAWDSLQFRVEEGDETNLGRSIDLVAAAAGESVIVEGRSYFDFETILPVECKRLPTPSSSGRDEREYVATRTGTTGGIQRFKLGLHGAAHTQAAMIAYVQDGTFEQWLSTVQRWIEDMHLQNTPGWSASDALIPEAHDAQRGMAVHRSTHTRASLPDVRLHHLWIDMGKPRR